MKAKKARETESLPIEVLNESIESETKRLEKAII
jgi:hypothetical protein